MNTIVRCRGCRRLHSSYAEFCPDCGRRSRRAWIKLLVMVTSVLLAVVALVVAFLLSRNTN